MRGKSVLLASTLTLLATLTTTLAQAQQLHFYVFGTSGCPACMKLKLSLAKEFGGEALTFYDIAEDRDYLTALHRIYELLLPNSTAKPIPLTGVFVDDRLRLVIVGYCDVDKLRELLSRAGSRVVVYRLGEEWSVGERVASELSKLFSNLREPLRLKLWSRFTGCCQ